MRKNEKERERERERERENGEEYLNKVSNRIRDFHGCYRSVFSFIYFCIFKIKVNIFTPIENFKFCFYKDGYRLNLSFGIPLDQDPDKLIWGGPKKAICNHNG